MNEKVLVIENSVPVGSYLGELLGQGGYCPIVATTAPDGIAMIASFNGHVKAALVDITSCDDALAVANKLEAAHPNITVIFSGNFYDRHQLSPFLLSKPYDAEEVLTKVALSIG